MARKPITKEDITPSYEEIVNELLATISKLLMENAILKLSNKKLEVLVSQFASEIDQSSDESKNNF